MIDSLKSKQVGTQAISVLREVIVSEVHTGSKRNRALNAITTLEGIISSL